jgi:hypothetical protein
MDQHYKRLQRMLYLFEGVEFEGHWSSTTQMQWRENAWMLRFFDGRTSPSGKIFDGHYVWPVRGGN